ncbi:MAG: PEP-CTERM sorting domain-containing protein [Rhodothermia bacterium]
MSKRTLSITLIATVASMWAMTGQLHAIPTQVEYADAPICDTLFIPKDVDEIGRPPLFPTDELLDSVSTQTFDPACPTTDDPSTANALVVMTNLTGRDLEEVWYVANNETRISNVDGFANDIGFPIDSDNEAFRIDSKISDPGGKNLPLVAESGIPNDIWEAGETWSFILQDYSNSLGILPEALISIGVGDASIPVVGLPESSGSIIAIPRIPEPGSAVLALLGMTVCGFLSRRKKSVSNVTG